MLARARILAVCLLVPFVNACGGSEGAATPAAGTSDVSRKACRTNADCRKFTDYSQGCDCRVLSVCQKDPDLAPAQVDCLLDPCMLEQAYCNAGNCALRPGPAACQADECGPLPGTPDRLCPDGKTVTGPTGRCLRQPSGSCGWEIVAGCPDPGVCPATP